VELTEDPDVKIENMVGRADFRTKINLDISSLVLDRAIYEPEVFPGLIYKVVEPHKICFLIFNSGKVICTGASDLEIIKTSLKTLAQTLKQNSLLGFEAEQKPEKLDLDLMDLF